MPPAFKLCLNTDIIRKKAHKCAFAGSLGEMIVFRAGQGFTGGVLIPMAFTIVLTTLPPAKQPIGLAMFSDFTSHGANPSSAHNQALKNLANIIRREAYVMAYNDCFYFIGIALLVCAIALLFNKKVKASATAAAH